MQMPFMEYDLDYLLETQKELFTPNVLKQIMFQILSAVLFLHSGNIVHRY
jgi:serine/threonine protein kinase